MNGYLRVAAISPKISVGNVKNNLEEIKKLILILEKEKVKILVTPRLALTSINLFDVFLDENILKAVDDAIFDLMEYSKNINMVIVITHPLKYNNSLYEVATVINKGRILGMVPRDEYDEDNKKFSNGKNIDIILKKYNYINSKFYYIPLCRNLVFVSEENENIKFSINFANDNTTSYANIILNPHSIKETYDAEKYYNIYKNISQNNGKVYVVASPSFSESTTKDVYYQRTMIYEDGELVNKSNKVVDEYVIADIDIDKISAVKNNNNLCIKNIDFNKEIFFSINDTAILEEENLYRRINTTPYISKNNDSYNYSVHILNIQALGLLKRYYASHSKTFVIGYSGGLDSTLALMVIKRTCDMGNIPLENIKCITMPCFGSSNQSIKNAINFTKSLGISLINIDIKNAVMNHLNDIGHNIENKNTTYENAQARERTQVLMDFANDNNGFVVGTSDLSEIALGFSTYNGDHMAMYNVNSSIPKTLIRYMLNSIAEFNLKNNGNTLLANTLNDILQQPVSPELVNDNPDNISQKTEDILGPYKLIDFYLYYYLSYHFDKEKLLDLAKRYFYYNEKEIDRYDISILTKTLDTFMNRFYKSQYKRNTSPDGISIGFPDLNSKFSFIAPSDLEI